LKTNSDKTLLFGFTLSSFLILYSLFTHRSPAPWIWELYSFPYFILLVLVFCSLFYIGILIYLYHLKSLYILAANLAILFGLAITVEIGGQLYAHLHPSYKIIPFMPDPMLGWRIIPKSEHIVSGRHWYAREFSSKVQTNSLGFRDHERQARKDNNTIRIALLGDSMVAAREVDFEKTAGQVLEKRLNQELFPKTKKKYEVLNFGVPGYGIDQIFLNWRTFVSKFKPDFVFLYIFEKNYFRTISSTWCSRQFFGIDDLGDRKCLFIRPVATVKKTSQKTLTKSQKIALDFLYIQSKHMETVESLLKSKNYSQVFHLLKNLPMNIYLPRDYKKFIEEQKKYIEKEMNGKRMVKRKKEIFLQGIFANTIQQLKKKYSSGKLKSTEDKKNKYQGDRDNFPSWLTTNLVNLRIIQFLSRLVKASSGKLAIIDTFSFHNESNPSLIYASNLLKQLANFENMKYIPLHKIFNKLKDQGYSLTWKYDPHLNELGNEIFANTLFDILEKDSN